MSNINRFNRPRIDVTGEQEIYVDPTAYYHTLAAEGVGTLTITVIVDGLQIAQPIDDNQIDLADATPVTFNGHLTRIIVTPADDADVFTVIHKAS